MSAHSTALLPPGWGSASFDDVFVVISDGGRRVPQRAYQLTGCLPVIDQGEAMVGGYSNDMSLAYKGPLPVLVFGDHTRRTKLIERPFAVGAQGVKLLAPRTSFDPKFLFYLLPTLDLEDRGYSRHFQYLRRLTFPTPPLAEQGRIVAAIEERLSELDAAVVGIERVEVQSWRYRAAVLKGASDGSTIGEDPLLWPVQALGGVLTSLRNGISTKPTAQFGQAILRISSVRAMSVDLRDVRYLDPDADWRRYQLADNDLLFTRYNGNAELVGACGRVRGLRDSLVHPDKLIRGTVDVSRADPAYLEIALNSGLSRAFIRSHVKTSAGQAGISGHDLKLTPVRLPPLDTQRRIVADAEQRLSIVEAIEKAVRETLMRSVGLRQQILRRAFDGRLVQQDFNDEPGQALIQHSRAECAPVSRGERARRPVKLR